MVQIKKKNLKKKEQLLGKQSAWEQKTDKRSRAEEEI